ITHYIDEKTHDFLKRSQIHENDILLSIAGSIGTVCIIPKELVPSNTNQALSIIRLINIFEHPNYVFYYLRFSSKEFLSKEKARGSGMNNVSLKDIKQLQIPLPPLNEQQRIVAKLDALLPKVKHAQARLAKIPGLVKKFRQSVLAAACSGRLTEDWREGKDLPEWEETTIREIAISMSTGPFGSTLHSYDYIENGIPVINPTNITGNKIIPDNSATLNQEKADELSRYKLRVNDILLARRGDLSKCGIVTEKEENWIAGSGLFILRISINPKFFRYLFISDSIQKVLNNNSVGSTMLNLNQKIVGSIGISIPPLEEQHEIVRRVDCLFALADSLEAKYSNAMQRVAKIEQALLSKAFRGELAPSDPQDEPAELLLQRILAEKAKSEDKQKTRKAKKKQSHR
ncbi:MAG: restriction endonuclease subunit S, partial [Candidatus Vecturithrix sp.]|nr:restriction endonuclease subunit S [Candidatus Vecturithrix sp.]